MPPISANGVTNYHIGIDPGYGGGMAVIRYNPSVGATLSCTKMPETEADTYEWLSNITSYLAKGDSVFAVIEKVHSMPRQGVASTFKFGVSYGGLRMALIAAGIPFENPLPHQWQKALGIPKRKPEEGDTQWKARLKAKAQELWPKQNVTLKTADAILLAEYCRRRCLMSLPQHRQ